MSLLFEKWLVQLATPEHLKIIAQTDYGRDADRHYQALIKIISNSTIKFITLAHESSYNVLRLGSYYQIISKRGDHVNERVFAAILSCGILIKNYALHANQDDIDDEPITIFECYLAVRDFAPDRLKDYSEFLEEIEVKYKKPNNALPFYDIARSVSYFTSGFFDKGEEALTMALKNVLDYVSDNKDFRFENEPLFEHIVAGDRYMSAYVQELKQVVPNIYKGKTYNELLKYLER